MLEYGLEHEMALLAAISRPCCRAAPVEAVVASGYHFPTAFRRSAASLALLLLITAAVTETLAAVVLLLHRGLHQVDGSAGGKFIAVTAALAGVSGCRLDHDSRMPPPARKHHQENSDLATAPMTMAATTVPTTAPTTTGPRGSRVVLRRQPGLR